MSRIYLLDTNTVSYIVKGRSLAARTRLASLPPDRITISSITEAEIHYGIAKQPGAQKWQAAVLNFLFKIQVLPWGREEALAYGSLRAKLEAAGQSLGNMDLLIAAHAIAADAILVTNDQALTRTLGLPAVENWATDL